MNVDVFREYPWLKPQKHLMASTGKIYKQTRYAAYLQHVFDSVLTSAATIPHGEENKWRHITATLIHIYRKCEESRPQFYLKTSEPGCVFGLGGLLMFIAANETQLSLISAYLDSGERSVVCRTDHPVLVSLSGILAELS